MRLFNQIWLFFATKESSEGIQESKNSRIQEWLRFGSGSAFILEFLDSWILGFFSYLPAQEFDLDEECDGDRDHAGRDSRGTQQHGEKHDESGNNKIEPHSPVDLLRGSRCHKKPAKPAVNGINERDDYSEEQTRHNKS